MMPKNKSYMLYWKTPDKGYEVTKKTYSGKEYYVVPVIMMVEGVHHGSRGPLLHTIDELGMFPESWNGIPVVIDHPEVDGVPVSANSPEVLESCQIGTVYNTMVDGTRLKSEAWIDPDKLAKIAPELIETLDKGEIIEVSIGVFSEEEEVEGEWNGEKYTAIARNHRPDHLAFLPYAEGACSVVDGCGVRTNKNGKNMDVKQMITDLRSKGFAINEIGDHAAQGYGETMNMVMEVLGTLNTDDTYHYLEELYDEYLVYSKQNYNEGTRQMYKQEYKIESGKVELVDNPVEVHRKVEYIAMEAKGGLKLTKLNFNNKEVTMSDKTKECPDCLKKIDALIANEQSPFVEDDRDLLLNFSLEQLEKLEPVIVEKEVEKTVEVNVLSDEDKQALAAYKAEQKEKRDTMIKEIQANTSEETWPTEVLEKFDKDNLTRLHESVKKEEVTDYSVMGGGPSPTGVAPLLPAGVESETKKE